MTSLHRRAHDVIPGGCHTYAKGDDQYPEGAPFIRSGKGCRVRTADGAELIEYGMGLRAVTLGHAYDSVIDAACTEMRNGVNFNRPSPLEVEAAEALLGFLPRADMVKFAKDGSTVLTAAITLARAHTGRVKIAVCRDHPFFSYNDWFMITTGIPGGIPEARREETLTFPYNDLEAATAMFAEHDGEISCVLLEAARTGEPNEGYLAGLRDLAHRNGALFIIDEMVTGFRWHNGGAQEVYDVEPDLATFGKALGNGFPISALVGKREVMELGGLEHERERVFLLSTTHGAETGSLAAALAVMEVYRNEDVIGTLYRQGERLRAGVQATVDSLGLQDFFTMDGRPCSILYGTRGPDGKPSQPYRTLFLQETLKRGLLAPNFIMSYSHSDADIDATIERVSGALGVYQKAIESGPDEFLDGPSIKPVYRRFN